MKSISVNNRPRSVRTIALVKNRPISNRYASMYYRRMTDVIDMGQLAEMLHESTRLSQSKMIKTHIASTSYT